MHIGNVIRRCRKAKGISLAELASHVPGYDAGNLSRFETGKQDIPYTKLKALADALGMKLSDLFIEVETGASLPQCKRDLIQTIEIADISDSQAAALQQFIKSTIA